MFHTSRIAHASLPVSQGFDGFCWMYSAVRGSCFKSWHLQKWVSCLEWEIGWNGNPKVSAKHVSDMWATMATCAHYSASNGSAWKVKVNSQ